jgi:hypothetical protein
MERKLDTIMSLEAGEKTVIYLPNRDVTHHWFRKTEDGFETCFTLTEWREISADTIREELKHEA